MLFLYQISRYKDFRDTRKFMGVMKYIWVLVNFSSQMLALIHGKLEISVLTSLIAAHSSFVSNQIFVMFLWECKMAVSLLLCLPRRLWSIIITVPGAPGYTREIMAPCVEAGLLNIETPISGYKLIWVSSHVSSASAPRGVMMPISTWNLTLFRLAQRETSLCLTRKEEK